MQNIFKKRATGVRINKSANEKSSKAGQMMNMSEHNWKHPGVEPKSDKEIFREKISKQKKLNIR